MSTSSGVNRAPPGSCAATRQASLTRSSRPEGSARSPAIPQPQLAQAARTPIELHGCQVIAVPAELQLHGVVEPGHQRARARRGRRVRTKVCLDQRDAVRNEPCQTPSIPFHARDSKQGPIARKQLEHDAARRRGHMRNLRVFPRAIWSPFRFNGIQLTDSGLVRTATPLQSLEKPIECANANALPGASSRATPRSRPTGSPFPTTPMNKRCMSWDAGLPPR